MDKAKRQELRELAAKATPRPYFYDPGKSSIGYPGGWLFPISDKTRNQKGDIPYSDNVDYDAYFIVLATNNIIPLLDELERVEIERDNYQESVAMLAGELKKLVEIMPCGHPARYAVNEDGGTNWCALCELEKTRNTLLLTEQGLADAAGIDPNAYQKLNEKCDEQTKRIAELEAITVDWQMEEWYCTECGATADQRENFKHASKCRFYKGDE